MPLAHLIKTRRAIRRYQDKPVPKALVSNLLETAMYAPSAHNRQPWRFGVLTTPESKAMLANAMGGKLRTDRMADGDNFEVVERDVARSFARITGAPVVVVVCLSMADMDTYPDAHRNWAEQTMAVQSVAMAAQNLWLLAHEAGLGACWLCAPLFVPALVRGALKMPADWQPQGLLTLGYPAEQKAKERQPWQEKVLFI